MNFETNDASKETSSSFALNQDRVVTAFDQMKGMVMDVFEKESSYLKKIQQLEADLVVFKRAYNDVESERKQLQWLRMDAEKEKDELKNQLKGHRVITLLDGDGAIFSTHLISQGQTGGHSAAQILSDAIMQHLVSMNGPHQYQLWVYIFLNKRGLMDTFSRLGLGSVKLKFEDFILGFNQASERFMMVDVGSGKEAADAKIKAFLEDDIRLPQTDKIIFGGCHDNGYVSTLRSQITSGFKHKLILLKSYSDMAAGIAELELPTINIPDLFLTQKLGIMPISSTPKLPTAALAPLPLIGSFQPPVPATGDLVPDHELDPLPFFSVGPEAFQVSQHHSPPSTSYSSALQMRYNKRIPTPELDSAGSSSSDGSDEVSSNPRASPTFKRSRHVNPNIPLSKHKPPPCTLFYLASCKHGAGCKYGHDYLLQPEHFSEIRANAKKAPCPAINKGEQCLWGEECCYGHKCPLTTKCFFLKQGRCKFIGVTMHKELN